MKNQQLANGVVDLRTNDIEPHPLNPRKEFTHEELLSLGESLRTKGHLQPIMVRPAPADSRRRYQIVYGERRWRAAAFVGLETIRAEVRELTDLEALELMGEENLQRKEWNAMELAEFFAMLKRPESEGGFNLTDEQIGRQFGMVRGAVTNLRRLLVLPESLKNMVRSGELSQTSARALVPYVDRPEVMRAIESDMKLAPEEWRRRDDVTRRRVELVASRVEAPETSTAAIAPGDACDDGALSGNAANKGAKARGALHLASITRKAALALLRPYASCVAALELIREVVDEALEKARAAE